VSIFLITLIATGKESSAQQERLVLAFAPGVLEELNGIRAELVRGVKNKEIEDVRCLLGSIKENQAHVTGLQRPFVKSATRFRVITNLNCKNGTIGWWHNHPSGRCALSKGDQEMSVRKNFPIIMLHCSNKRWAWWTLDQIKELSGAVKGRLYPLPNQDMVKNNPK